jgi:hypothetical protein
MDAIIAKKQSLEWLMRHSRFEPDRKYLGMCGIGKCALRLYRECLLGRRAEVSPQTARRCYRGYLFEDDAHKRLAAAGVYRRGSEKEITAPWDARFRGHTDGETPDGDLLEIKSVNNDDYEMIMHNHRVLSDHYDQVQMYLLYGGYKHAVIAYIDTETFKEFFQDVYPDPERQNALEAKARSIIDALDGGPEPACTCRRCFQSKAEIDRLQRKGEQQP